MLGRGGERKPLLLSSQQKKHKRPVLLSKPTARLYRDTRAEQNRFQTRLLALSTLHNVSATHHTLNDIYSSKPLETTHTAHRVQVRVRLARVVKEAGGAALRQRVDRHRVQVGVSRKLNDTTLRQRRHRGSSEKGKGGVGGSVGRGWGGD